MKKIIPLILFILGISLSNSQSLVDKDTTTIKNNPSVKVDWTMDTFLKAYKDSINSSIKTGIIPKFLSNACFDYDHKLYWEPKHNPESFRKNIIHSITDIKTLEFLLQNKRQLSHKKCYQLLEHLYGGRPEKMDSQDLTNFRLVKIRLKQLIKGSKK